jgi:hypothetical protein
VKGVKGTHVSDMHQPAHTVMSFQVPKLVRVTISSIIRLFALKAALLKGVHGQRKHHGVPLALHIMVRG